MIYWIALFPLLTRQTKRYGYKTSYPDDLCPIFTQIYNSYLTVNYAPSFNAQSNCHPLFSSLNWWCPLLFMLRYNWHLLFSSFNLTYDVPYYSCYFIFDTPILFTKLMMSPIFSLLLKFLVIFFLFLHILLVPIIFPLNQAFWYSGIGIFPYTIYCTLFSNKWMCNTTPEGMCALSLIRYFKN